ncbi:MAG: TlpA disulfide reductase family protein [Candidatus Cloacimonetes bacterium]|nr:TlpA disulfide reductase family protein [Candidatus Cloacimonadota bacterium]
MKKSLFTIMLAAILLTVLTAEEKEFHSSFKDFTLEDINGNMVKISDFMNDSIIILDFWASWCTPCKRALPALNEIHQNYDKVNVLAVTIDKPKDQSKSKNFVKSQKFDFITLFDTNTDLSKHYNVTTIPRTFILNPQGEILYDHTGYTRGDESKYKEIIDAFLEKTSKE